MSFNLSRVLYLQNKVTLRIESAKQLLSFITLTFAKLELVLVKILEDALNYVIVMAPNRQPIVTPPYITLFD